MTDGGAEAWNAASHSFDDEPDHGLADPLTRAAWRRLLLSHLPASSADVVDLGCGTGTLSVLLTGEGYQVTGLDFAEAMVAAAVRKAEAACLATTFIHGDATSPPFEPGSFDVVLSRHVLWALPDPAAALQSWTRLLRPGGRLVLVEGRWHTGSGLTADECSDLLRRSGRSVVVHPLTEPVYWGGEISDERYVAISTH
jgi:SAM-dependent methyltransferase